MSEEGDEKTPLKLNFARAGDGKDQYGSTDDSSETPTANDSPALPVKTKNYNGSRDDAVLSSDEPVSKPAPGWSCCLQCLVGGPKAFAFWSMLSNICKVSGILYLGAVITTIEKQFRLSSTQSGAIAILSNAMDAIFVIFVSYFGHKGHRPRIISLGLLMTGIGFIVCSLPHVMIPPYTTVVEGCGNATEQFDDVCLAEQQAEDVSLSCSHAHGAQKPLFDPVVWLILGQILIGIGNVPVRPLGSTYIDDAVGKHTTPVFVAFVSIGGTLGPIFGLTLATVCLMIFVDFDRVPPGDRPVLSNEDPRFIGAWWLGFVMIGCMIILFSIPFAFFPRYLPKTAERMREERENESTCIREQAEEVVEATEDADEQIGSLLPDQATGNTIGFISVDETETRGSGCAKAYSVLKNMLSSYRKILSNLPLFLLCLATATSVAAMSAQSSFGLKYYNVEFQLPASKASILAMVVLPFLIGGNLTGAILIRRQKWSPTKCALLLVCGDVVALLIIPVLLVIGCDTKAIAGVSAPYEPPPPYNTLPPLINPITLPSSAQMARSQCNANCTCGNDYNPVCGADGLIYVSPCYAGCEDADTEDKTKIKSFSNCRCIDPTIAGNATATDGECPGTCPKWETPLLGAMMIIRYFFLSLGGTASVLIVLRIVEEDLRATAIGLHSLLNSVLGSLPAPIYIGAAINAACILWGYEDEERGNCWIYDGRSFRYAFQGLEGCIKLVSVVFYTALFFVLFRKQRNTRKDVHNENVAEASGYKHSEDSKNQL